MTKLIVMVGESGSGKSTRAKEMLIEAQKNGQNLIRVNRDSIRTMLFGADSSWDFRLKRENETMVRHIEEWSVRYALGAGIDVIVDDLNISTKTQNRWAQFASQLGCGFEVEQMHTPFEECVRRDNLRTGREHVGRAVIERQFLSSGRADFGTKSIVLVDLDGTLCNSDGIRNPYDEERVHQDDIYPVIAEWVKELSKDHSIVLVSGRHASCGDSTWFWLNSYDIPFDHLLMRNSGDNRPDTVIKKEILDGMLKCGVSKEQIKFVLDDRPKVIRMWKENGLKVYPVRGAIEEF